MNPINNLNSHFENVVKKFEDVFEKNKVVVEANNLEITSLEKIKDKFKDFPENLRNASLVDLLKNPKLSTFSGLSDHSSSCFAALHLGRRAKGTGFEGVPHTQAVEWSTLVLEELSRLESQEHLLKVPQSDQLLLSTKQLSAYANNVAKTECRLVKFSEPIVFQEIKGEARKIASEVKNLIPGTSYFMSGGYSASPTGHAMYYRFIREIDNTYTVVLYNAGAGAQWQAFLESEHQRRLIPFVVYSKVLPEQLFFSSHDEEIQPGLFQALLEMEILPDLFPLNKRFDFGVSDVWKAFAHIQHKMIDPSLYNRTFVTAQDGVGNCAQKSLNALLHDLIRDEKVFKSYKLNSLLLSLVNFYHAHAHSLEKNYTDMAQVRFQLREAALNLCQRLSIYSERDKDSPELSETQLAKFYATAIDIIERVDEAAQKAKETAFNSVPKLERVIPVMEVSNNYWGLKTFTKVNQTTNFSKKDISTPFFTLKTQPSGEQFFNTLADLNQLTEKMDQEGAIFEIETFFSRLPVPIKYPNDPCWSKVKDFDPKQLAKILNTYIDLSMEGGAPLYSPKQYNTIMQMLAIMHQLCWQFDADHGKGVLKELSLGLNCFEDLYLKDPLLVAKDPESWERGESLLRYFQSVKKPGKEIFNYSKNRDIKSEEFKPELDLYIDIMKYMPTYLEKFAEKNFQSFCKDWESLKLDEFKLAGLYSGFYRGLFFEFTDPDHGHVALLRGMMVNTLAALGMGKKHKEASSNPVITMEGYGGQLGIQSCGKYSPHNESNEEFLKNAHRAWEDEIVEEFSKPYLESYFERAPEKIKQFGQGAHLQAQIAQSEEEKSLSDIASAACEPDSTIATLLYKLLENPSIVENPKSQALIQYLLRKPYFKRGRTNPVVPLFEDLKNQPEARLRFFQQVIEKGIQLHFSLRSPENVNVPAALYFIRLGQQISKAYFQIHQEKPPLSLYPENILEEIEATLRQKNPLSLPLLAAVSLHQMEDLMVPYKKWSTEEWGAIYSKWLAISSLGSLDRYPEIDRSLYQEVKEQMKKLEPELMRKVNEQNFIPSLLNQVLNELGLSGNFEASWFKRSQVANQAHSEGNQIEWKMIRNQGKTLTFYANLQDKGKVSINLTTGQILSNYGFLSLGKIDSEDKNFQKVFGQRNLQLTGYEKAMQFTDELYGECRIIEGNLERFIQRKIGNDWFTYIPLQAIDGPIPIALLGGYTHWEGEDSAIGKNVMLISDEKTGKHCYYVDKNGTIREWQNGSANTKESLGHLALNNFSNVEDHNYIFPWIDEKEGMTRIEFIRLRTKEGGRLSFNCKEDKCVYHNDPHYQLEIQAKSAYLGNFSHFISLVHENGDKRKLLVPNHQLVSNGFSTKAGIIIENEEGEWEKHDRIYSYFEFNVVNEEVVAEDLEGWLKLSHIFLAQKDYEKAIHYLNKITLSDEITPLARQLFKEILASGPYLHDYSPNACALRMKAFWLVRKLDPFTAGYRNVTKGVFAEHISAADFYATYLSGLNHVYHSLRLPLAIEKEIIPMLGEGGKGGRFERRETFLEKGSYAPVPFSEKIFANSPQPWADLQLGNPYPFSCFDLAKVKDHQTHEYSTAISLLNTKPKYYDEGFLEYYEVLKTGSEAEKRDLIYRLQWRWHSRARIDNQRFHNHLEEYLLHFVYKHPELVPDPKLGFSSEAEKLDWFCQLVKAFQTSPKDNGHSITEPFPKEYNPERHLDFVAMTTPGLPSNTIHPSIQHTPLVANHVEADLEKRLSQIGHEFLISHKDSSPTKGEKTFKLSLDLAELNEGERPYSKVIAQEFDAFNLELEAGRLRKIEDLPPSFKIGKIDACKETLKQLESEAKQKCEKLEGTILKIARRLPIDERASLKAGLTKTGFVKQEVNIMDLARAAASGQLEDYAKLLPYLNQEDIEELHPLVVKYLVDKTSYDQIKAALAPLEKHGDKTTSEAEKMALLQESAAILSLERQYVPEENLQALYFEYASRLRLRKDQARLFKQIVKLIFKKGTLADKGFVFQLIQAGGKSSVMLSRLMELVAEKGYLSILVCHHSQMSSAQGIMKKYQRERFEKNVILLNYPSHQLENFSVLEHIEKTLKDVEKGKDGLVINSSMIQFLQLQLLSLLKQRKELEEEGGQDQYDTKIGCLQRINKHLAENGVGMFDEVDLTLDIHQQANSPNGRRFFLEKERVSLTHKIFQFLSLPEIDQIVALSNNEQKNLSEKKYWETVVPLLAKKLFQSVPRLKLNAEHEAAFYRYIANQIDIEIEKLALGCPSKFDAKKLNEEETQNLSFLKHLHLTLSLSSDPDNAEAAQLIALARGIIGKILPTTLKKSFNKDYGSDPNQPERIIPYLAVGVPAETEFGYVYEHLCYIFQSAVNAPISSKAVEKYAESMTELANRYVGQGEKFEETAEAEQFFKLTKVKLAEVFRGDNLKKAAEAINQSLELKLEFQAEMAARYATYYESFFGSSPLALVDQFKNSFGCSGTVSNIHSYNPKISHLLQDKGAEGKIISTLLERYENGTKEAPIVNPDNLTQFLKQSLDAIPDKSAHCLIDGGGLLKRFTSEEVAKEILNYYKVKDNNARIQGVIFFLRQQDPLDPNVYKESFALLKAGAESPILLANTTKDQIEKHGIKVKNLFFSLDELRATGSDVPMPADACGVGTVSADSLRAIGQMVMRMRKLFVGQNLDIVVTQPTEQTLIGNSRKMIDIIRTALKNQAINKSNDTFRSFKEQIPNLFRTKLMEQLIKLDPEKAADLESAFNAFFESKFKDVPLTQFGFLDEEAKSYDILEEIGKEQLKKFDESLIHASDVLDKKTAEEIRQKVSEEISALILRAKEYPELNCLFQKNGGVELGLQMQRAVNVEQNSQMQTALQINVEEETRRYNAKNKGDLFKEIPWNSNGIDPWNSYRIGPELFSVSSLLQDCDNEDKWIKKKGLYQNNYSGCFPEYIKMTENLRQTFTEVMSVFHPLQKAGEQLLVRKLPDGRLEAIMLSQKDLAFWTQRGKTPKDTWLMNAEGVLLVEGTDPLPNKQSYFWNNLEEALWYVNFFNGNVGALERRPFLTQVLLTNAKAPMHRFLYLRTAHQPGQRNVLEKSPLFALNKGVELVNNIRYAREKEKQTEIEKMDDKEIGTLKAEYAPLVPPEKISYLKEPEQIRNLLPEQINKINSEHVDSLLSRQVAYLEEPKLIQALTEPSLIKEIPMEHACHLNEAQRIHHPIGIKEEKDPIKIQTIGDPELINQLGPEQVKMVLPEQVVHINPKYVSHLEKPEQIEKLEGRNQINAIDGSALKYLTPEQYRQLRNPALIRQVSREFIKYLDPLAIPFLDVKTQLPYLESSQHLYVSKEQYQKICNEETLPENLKPLWGRISPISCKVYKEILKGTGKLLTSQMPGINEWEYLLQLMGELRDGDYAKVDKLSLFGHKLAFLPPELFRCKNLTYLDLSHFDISSFDGDLSFDQFFPNLEVLWLCDVGLKAVPPSLRRLSKLTDLRLDKNSIERIPEWIGELRNLTQLSLSHNKLTEMTLEIGKLTSLKYLWVDHNELTSLPSEIGQLINLYEIQLNNNQLNELPESMGELKKLTSLLIYHNKLTSIPGCVAELPEINYIYAAKNCITTLPPEMEQSPALNLSLALNPIKEFPKVLYKMGRLQELDLEGCHINEINEEISNLKRVRCLYLSGNPIVSISNEIGKLKNLQTLSLQGTKLKTLPETLGELPKLRHLFLAHSPIESLPKSLSSQSLQKIGLKETYVKRNSPEVQALLDKGCVVDYDELEMIGGYLRIREGEFPEWVIEGKSDPNEKPIVPPEALDDLISADKLYPIQQLIKSGLDPNTKLGAQDSLLHWAVRNGHDELTKEMLEKDGDLTGVDQNGETPLTLLCRNFPAKTDLIQQMIAKRDKETLSVSEGKALMSAISASTDLVKRHQLHNSLKITTESKLPKNSLAELLKETAQEVSNPFLARCLEKSAELVEIGHLFFAMISEKMASMFRTLLGQPQEESSWKEIGLSSYLLEKEMHSQKEETNQLITNIANGEMTVEKYQEFSTEKRSELLRWASLEGQQEVTSLLMLMEAKLSPKIHNNDKLITNLFFDKSWIMTDTKEVADSNGLAEKGLYGMCPHIAALAIAGGLKKALNNPQEQIPEKLVKQVGEELLPQLERAASWDRLSSSQEGTVLVVEQIFDALKQLENNKKILVPIGNKSHNFLVQILKTDEEKYSLKVINTGLGLSHHPRLGNQRLFQTTIAFEEIPSASVFQKEIWKELLDLQRSPLESVDKHYELISKKLGAGGKKAEASKERLDYSMAQLQGTCSSSPWWSWLRHEVVELGTEKGDRWLAYAEWRVLKNHIREKILQGVESDTLKEKVQQTALEKIKRDAHLNDLLAISQDADRFNETIAIVKQMLEKLPAEVKTSLGNIDRDFIDYENSGTRWHLLRQISLRFAKEIHLMGPKKQKRFISDINEHAKDPCLSYAFLQLIDFQNTEKHLEMLFKDAQQNKDWKLIGTTLGRLVLDPKLSALVTRLCKRWLTLREEAKSRLLEEEDRNKAEEEILEHFLFYVMQGKKQEKVLRDLAVHYGAHKETPLAEKLWKAHRSYIGDKFGTLVYRGTIGTEHAAVIANTLESIDDVSTLLLALRNHSLDVSARSTIDLLIDKAIKMDDEEYSHLRKVADNLYAARFDHFADTIKEKVLPLVR